MLAAGKAGTGRALGNPVLPLSGPARSRRYYSPYSRDFNAVCAR